MSALGIVPGDLVSATTGHLLTWLEQEPIGIVVAVSRDVPVNTGPLRGVYIGDCAYVVCNQTMGWTDLSQLTKVSP